MNMKEKKRNLLRNERTTTGEVDKTDRTVIGKCIHLYDETLGNKETPVLSTENCLRQVQKKKKAKKKTDKKNLMWNFFPLRIYMQI